MAKRGEAELAPLLELAGIERFEVLVFGEEENGMIGEEGLEDNLAGKFCPSGAACNLGDELEDSFSGSEVGDV